MKIPQPSLEQGEVPLFEIRSNVLWSRLQRRWTTPRSQLQEG